MDNRLYAWVYGLWYPALLGTAGVLVATSPRDQIGWALFLLAYLTVQYGEGVRHQKHGSVTYGVLDIAFDILEIGAMAMAFTSMNYPLLAGATDPPQPILPPDPCWMAAMFAAPAIHRVVRLVWPYRGVSAELRVHQLLITSLSGVAILSVLLLAEPLWALWGILAVYLVAYVIYRCERLSVVHRVSRRLLWPRPAPVSGDRQA